MGSDDTAMRSFTAIRTAILLVCAMACATPLRAQSLTLRIDRGLVTLHALDVPLSTILAQWARVGGATVVNGDRVRARVTLDLRNEPERSALAILLRDVNGYMLAERVLADGSARIDRILIAPPSSAVPSQVLARPLGSAPRFIAEPEPADTPEALSMPISLPSVVGRATSAVAGAVSVPPVVLPEAGVGGNSPDLVHAPPSSADGRRSGSRHPPVRGREPLAQPPGQADIPANPFGVGTGNLRPGTIAPVVVPPDSSTVPVPPEGADPDGRPGSIAPASSGSNSQGRPR